MVSSNDPKKTVAYIARIYYQFPIIFNNLRSLFLPWTTTAGTTIVTVVKEGPELGPLLQSVNKQISICEPLLPKLQILINPDALFTEQLKIIAAWKDTQALDPFFDNLLDIFTFMVNTLCRKEDYLYRYSLQNMSPESISYYTNFVQLLNSLLNSITLEKPGSNALTPLAQLSIRLQQFCNHYEVIQSQFPSYQPLLQYSLQPNASGILKNFCIAGSLENAQIKTILDKCIETIADMKDDWRKILSELVSLYVQN